MDGIPSLVPTTSSSNLGSSSSSAHRSPDGELAATLSALYRLCHVRHEHVLQHVAVYPQVFEVVQRRSSREPAEMYLTAMTPRKERFHRCCVVATEYCNGGCLRDALSRGALSRSRAASGPLPHASGVGGLEGLDGMGGGSAMTATAAAAAAAAVGGGGPLPPQPVPGVVRMPYLPLLRTILLQVALGMQYLHAHGLIHGELRADNVLIQGSLPSLPELPSDTQHDQQDRGQQQQHVAAVAAAGGSANGAGFVLKVKDIGMCHLSTAARAVTVKKLVGRSRMHAVSWLPPECFRGQPLGKQGDVYAFGILMWELYTGQVRMGRLEGAGFRV